MGLGLDVNNFTRLRIYSTPHVEGKGGINILPSDQARCGNDIFPRSRQQRRCRHHRKTWYHFLCSNFRHLFVIPSLDWIRLHWRSPDRRRSFEYNLKVFGILWDFLGFLREFFSYMKCKVYFRSNLPPTMFLDEFVPMN